MELIYLWVQDYKNIQKQGFNFSPRFICKYDEKCNELTIDENKEYISIFPENINVTAIVGENGSGKSAIFEVLSAIFENRYSGTNFIVILTINKKLKLKTNMSINSQVDNYQDYAIAHYLYLSSEQILENSFLKENWDNFNHRLLLNDFFIADMISHSLISSSSFRLTTFMYVPQYIDIKCNFEQKIQDIINSELMIYPRNVNYNDNLTAKEEEKYDKEIRNHRYAKEDNLNNLFYHNNFEKYHQFLIIWYINEVGYEDNEYLLEDKDFLVKEFKNSSLYLDEHLFSKIFNDKTIKTNEISTKEKEIYFKNFKSFFEFDFIDSLQRKYSDLSHGEKTMFGELLNLYYQIQMNKKPILFLLDEPELSLHPSWQQKYFNELKNSLQQSRYALSIVVTSHSPFILSDLPKENVIFLDKGKQVDVNIETFGANIHTLLSHGFFMKDGLMGEFAKGKINETIKFLNKEQSEIKNEKEAKNIIDKIGEPFLQEKLLELYEMSYPPSNEEKIQSLKEQIKELENANA